MLFDLFPAGWAAEAQDQGSCIATFTAMSWSAATLQPALGLLELAFSPSLLSEFSSLCSRVDTSGSVFSSQCPGVPVLFFSPVCSKFLFSLVLGLLSPLRQKHQGKKRLFLSSLAMLMGPLQVSTCYTLILLSLPWVFLSYLTMHHLVCWLCPWNGF